MVKNNIILLTEQHIINKNHKLFTYCDTICYQSKNLYNLANYYIRQEFITNKKQLRYNTLDKILQSTEAYRTLISSTSQQILKILDKNYKSFFNAIKDYNNNPNKYKGKPKLPKYKDKIKGRNIVIFTTQQCPLKNGKIYLPNLRNEDIYNLSIKEQNKYFKQNNINKNFIETEHINIKQITITPYATCYKINIIYEKQEINNNLNRDNILGIDLGLNNFATCVNNVGNNVKLNPFIINGKPLKSINQYYNKNLSKLQSNLKINHNVYVSNKTNKLTLKRNNKIKDYLHKSSKYIIDYCIDNNIGIIVLGYNQGWKQNINLGKKTNQKFITIPYFMFKSMLEYKCKLYNIDLIITEESYTSKCSFIDNEHIKKHTNYLGKRIKRGIFKSFNNILINADVNAAYNIIRKVYNLNYDNNFNLIPDMVNM